MNLLTYNLKNLYRKFPCSSSPYIQCRPNQVLKFYLVNILTFSKWYATYICHSRLSILYRYKLFYYIYIHIVIPNALHLNKIFFKAQ